MSSDNVTADNRGLNETTITIREQIGAVTIQVKGSVVPVDLLQNAIENLGLDDNVETAASSIVYNLVEYLNNFVDGWEDEDTTKRTDLATRKKDMFLALISEAGLTARDIVDYEQGK